jgi:hypothetical protein
MLAAAGHLTIFRALFVAVYALLSFLLGDLIKVSSYRRLDRRSRKTEYMKRTADCDLCVEK